MRAKHNLCEPVRLRFGPVAVLTHAKHISVELKSRPTPAVEYVN